MLHSLASAQGKAGLLTVLRERESRVLSQSRADRRVASCVLCSSLATAASSAAGSEASHSGGSSSSSAFASRATCAHAALCKRS